MPRPTPTRRSAAARCAPGAALDSLLSAYRIGARVAWRRFAEAGVEAGLAPEVLYRLAEAIFAYIDVLSAESAEGHALEQSAAAGEARAPPPAARPPARPRPPADPRLPRRRPPRPVGRSRKRSRRSQWRRTAPTAARFACRSARSPRRSRASSVC